MKKELKSNFFQINKNIQYENDFKTNCPNEILDNFSNKSSEYQTLINKDCHYDFDKKSATVHEFNKTELAQNSSKYANNLIIKEDEKDNYINSNSITIDDDLTLDKIINDFGYGSIYIIFIIILSLIRCYFRGFFNINISFFFKPFQNYFN